MTKEVQRWADVAMWRAPEHVDPQHPKVTLTMAPVDPLGQMAMINGMYTGKIYTSPSDVTDEDRTQAWEDFFASKLSETPAEWFQVSLLFENVTRAFTHQLVRTRMGTYAQESMRFAVKEDLANAVKLPPSLANVDEELDPRGATEDQLKLNVWNDTVKAIGKAYQTLVDSGMPAEDARGLLPTNILTRVHMRCDIKTLINMAGMRLCTQAQFEWREVFAQVARAFREYGTGKRYATRASDQAPGSPPAQEGGAWWQYKLIAQAFQPVCYRAGHCPMQASADRTCSIRNRVEANAKVGRPSSEWEHASGRVDWDGKGEKIIAPIRPVEWLADPTAARQAP